jgi:hypothetical protein
MDFTGLLIQEYVEARQLEREIEAADRLLLREFRDFERGERPRKRRDENRGVLRPGRLAGGNAS